ncbi:MAG: isocitrate/isopropylmalate family dehydrogenase, partial [Acetanaerobacterium sp.]
MSQAHVVVLPGDGTGQELIEQGVRVVKEVCRIEGVALTLEYEQIGYAAYLAQGTPFSVLAAQKCRAANAVLLGPVGDENSAALAPHLRPMAGVLTLRAKLGLFTELCPVLIPERQVDMLLVRELCGGIYYGARGHTKVEEVDAAFDTEIYTEPEVERVAKNAFELAQKRRAQVVSVDRADVFESSRLWRAAVEKTAAAYPGVSLAHLSVNRAAELILSEPSRFDVLLCPNLFGSILASEAAALAGQSSAVVPRACIGYSRLGVYT